MEGRAHIKLQQSRMAKEKRIFHAKNEMKNVEMKFLSGTESGNILSFHLNVSTIFFLYFPIPNNIRVM